MSKHSNEVRRRTAFAAEGEREAVVCAEIEQAVAKARPDIDLKAFLREVDKEIAASGPKRSPMGIARARHKNAILTDAENDLLR